MVVAMECKMFNIENKKVPASLNFEQLSVQQLIDSAIDSSEHLSSSTNTDIDINIEAASRGELIKRGKDCIQTRIIIKKACKQTISNLEALLNKIATEKNNGKAGKAFKNKFLTSVSMLDRLQLEWQKYDLGLSQ